MKNANPSAFHFVLHSLCTIFVLNWTVDASAVGAGRVFVGWGAAVGTVSTGGA